jgi:hypothetical protein
VPIYNIGQIYQERSAVLTFGLGSLYGPYLTTLRTVSFCLMRIFGATVFTDMGALGAADSPPKPPTTGTLVNHSAQAGTQENGVCTLARSQLPWHSQGICGSEEGKKHGGQLHLRRCKMYTLTNNNKSNCTPSLVKYLRVAYLILKLDQFAIIWAIPRIGSSPSIIEQCGEGPWRGPVEIARGAILRSAHGLPSTT